MPRAKSIHVKRIYETPDSRDGFRILVDRLWPRGIKKERVKIDLWMKEIAPSDTLRKWFNHDPEKWEEFKRRYEQELHHKQDVVDQLRQHMKKNQVTFLFSAKETFHNNAVALKEFFLRRF